MMPYEINNKSFSPLRAKRRQSDAKWRASVAICYDALKYVVPNMRQMSKRKISKALILQEAEKHILDLQEKLFNLIEIEASEKGKALLWQEDGQWKACTLDNLKEDFSKQQQIVFQCATRGRRSYNLLQDIKDEVFSMQAEEKRLAIIDDHESISSLYNRKMEETMAENRGCKAEYTKQDTECSDTPTSSCKNVDKGGYSFTNKNNENTMSSLSSFNPSPVKVEFNNIEQRDSALTLTSLGMDEQEEPFQYTPIKTIIKNKTQYKIHFKEQKETNISQSNDFMIPAKASQMSDDQTVPSLYDVFNIKEENMSETDIQTSETSRRTYTYLDYSVKEEKPLEIPNKSLSTATVWSVPESKFVSNNAKKKLDFTQESRQSIISQENDGLKSPEQHAKASPMISGFTPIKFPKFKLVSSVDQAPIISPWKTENSSSDGARDFSMECPEQLELDDNLLCFEPFSPCHLGISPEKDLFHSVSVGSSKINFKMNRN